MGNALREIGGLTVLTYRSAIELVRRMWQAFGIAMALLIGASLVSLLIEMQIHTGIGRALVSTLCTIGGIWLSAPYLVSLYRFVLTGEVQRKPEILRGSDVANAFFGWSGILSFATAIPGYALVLLTPPGVTAADMTTGANALAVWITFFLLIALWIFTTRVITLLPGVALGVPMTISRALAESRGRFWFIVGAACAAIVPVLIASAFLGGLMGGALEIPRLILTIVALLVIGIASTANIYKWLMDHPK